MIASEIKLDDAAQDLDIASESNRFSSLCYYSTKINDIFQRRDRRKK